MWKCGQLLEVKPITDKLYYFFSLKTATANRVFKILGSKCWKINFIVL